MYLVKGATTGHTGSVIATGLLRQGKKVRVVARNAERLTALAVLGAETLNRSRIHHDPAQHGKPRLSRLAARAHRRVRLCP